MRTGNFWLFKRNYKSILAGIVISCLLSACAQQREQIVISNAQQSAHIRSVVDYRNQIDADHQDSIEAILALQDNFKELIETRFSKIRNKEKMTLAIVDWLLSEDHVSMQYDLNANLSPQQAYQQRVANCLSFSLLFYAIANHLGIESKFNYVDIPNIWNVGERGNIVLYRHINNVVRAYNENLIVDLALEDYNYGYPQAIIPLEDAIARLLSNRATNLLQENQLNQALHNIKLAVSLSPSNEDLWINLGVVYKQLEQLSFAEDALLLAFELNNNNELAASSLERFYVQIGETQRAKRYQVAAERARNSNPYHLYQLAQTNYQENLFNEAKSNIKRAIKLHRGDPRFFELSSLISQRQNRFDLALIDVVAAYELSKSTEDQEKYLSKAELISQRIDGKEIRLSEQEWREIQLDGIFNRR
ncbi:MAG: hypothetical protein KTR16_16370 [Acidiferrobacterales bacterium]|nr:hypothetical protein [Acidiferrobacterales bacterium]